MVTKLQQSLSVSLLGMFLMLAGFLPSTGWAETQKAIFAGGCFWCMESPFEKIDGVLGVVSGFAGGTEKNPAYKQVASGRTGHVESVEITYDPKRVTYQHLLEVFWQQIDPTDSGGQFVDRGFQYTTAIFYLNEEQRKLAEAAKQEIDKAGIYDKPVVTRIAQATSFYPAEAYHQDYYKNNPLRYQYYRYRSGRDQFLEPIWGEGGKGQAWLAAKKRMNGTTGMSYQRPSDAAIRKMLTPLQYKVTQEEGTERPFQNEYWDNKKAGIYVDIVSGEPLFSSKDKFVSGTGWPSFTRPLVKENIVEKEDYRLFGKRVEVRSLHGDSHLGHVFEDGPPPTGLRYCINSAALRFIPVEAMEREGYAEFNKGDFR